MAEFLCYSSENVTTCLIGYTPMQNEKFKVWEKINKYEETEKNWGYSTKDPVTRKLYSISINGILFKTSFKKLEC